MVKVATCWDDGVLNDIRLADIFRKYNAKATFNLNPGLMGEKRIDNRWETDLEQCMGAYNGFRSGKLALSDIAEIYSGFQLASHCFRHETAGRIPDDQFLKAALDARHFIEDIVQHECTGFAWPNGQGTQSTADLLLEAGFTYGRLTMDTDDVLGYTHPLLLKPTCHVLERAFIDKFKKAKEQNGVFYFWGHSYEMMDCQGMWDFMEAKIKYISEDPETEWIDVVDIPKLKA